MSESKLQTPGAFHVHAVDDEPEVREAIAKLVRVGGYEVSSSSSGEEALGSLENRKADLVVTDLMMPDMTGWQLLRQVKQRFPDIEVIVVTGYVPENAHEMLTNGDMAGYLVKPVNLEELQILLKGLLFLGNLGRQAEALIIDDKADALEAMKVAFERRGIFCDCYTDPGEAMERLKRSPVDIAVIDYRLRHADGFDIAQRLRSDPETRYMPLLIITSSPTTEVVQRAVEMRIDGFVAKPFDPKVLGDRVIQALRTLLST
ncbi:MAG: hypothetical protein CME26_10545 [Gemmatimonadetes bacterium]|nr:hypothetical protein [Gemmatimonadota bacterium]|tara:strand:- start:3328 stop:4107 length:780 start_codon:yes stop_codon:yes gene_type:complete